MGSASAMFRWVDHTSEIELEIEAASEEQVFAEGLRALNQLLGPPNDSAPARRQISVDGPDRPALLAAWLEELVFLAESEGFVAVAAEGIELQPTRAAGTALGAIGEPPALVKAVTYHRLEFTRSASGYCARVVLDV